jgi:hypothetical protein
MSRIDIEFANRRLAGQRFLTDADVPVYHDLCTRIQSLQRADETIPELPEPNAAGAWQAAYPVYQELKRRRAADAAKDAEAAISNGGLELRWNAFLAERGEVLEYLKHQSVSSDVLEYVGLDKSLLESPVDESEEGAKHGYPRRKNWQDMASRLGSAWYKLKNLSDVQRAQIPDVLARRRLFAAVKDISDRLSVLEQKAVRWDAVEEKAAWLDERVSAIESHFISKKH